MESRRSRLARFTRSSSEPVRTHHGPQPPLVAPAAACDQDPRQYASDPPEAVEHHVLRLSRQRLPAIDFSQFPAQESLHIPLRITFLEPGGQLADIYPRRGQVQPGQGLEDGKARRHGEFVLDHLAGKAMSLEDVDGGVVHQGAAVDRGDHAVVPIEFADERDHGLGDLLPPGPIGKVAFHLLVDHLFCFPLCGATERQSGMAFDVSAAHPHRQGWCDGLAPGYDRSPDGHG